VLLSWQSLFANSPFAPVVYSKLAVEITETPSAVAKKKRLKMLESLLSSKLQKLSSATFSISEVLLQFQ